PASGEFAGAGASGGDGGSEPGAGGSNGAGAFKPSSGGGDSGGGTDSGDMPAVVYGHGPNAPVRIDPSTKAVTQVRPLDGCSSVTDTALDKDSTLDGTTTTGLYTIDKDTAACTLVATGEYPNSLSFVPAGTVDANDEALVGYNGSDYVRIDTTTGAVTVI